MGEAIRVIRVLGIVVLLAMLLGLAGGGGASAQSCNDDDGNVGLSVNYNAVGYGEIGVCNMSANIDGQAVQHAMDAWNSMVGKPLLVTDCRVPSGVWITDVESGDCGDVACADRPWQESPLLLGLYVEPGASEWDLHDQKCLIVHEIGHNLGFDHWSSCTSVMHATLCDCQFLQPTAVDAQNYENAYWVEAVTSVTASSPSSGTVSLDWDTVNVAGQQLCNEKEFSIWRRNQSTRLFDTQVATAGQDSTGVSVGGQPSYSQCYRVWSVTEARAVSLAGHESIGVDVRPGSGGQDRDCDYWTDAKEDYIGTDPWDDCPDGSWDDAWPPDVNNSGCVNITDLVAFRPHMNCVIGQACYDGHFDLSPDGRINITDVVAVGPVFNKCC